MRFERSSIPEIGRLLAVLVSGRPEGRFAEIGTGTGVGSAWIASAMAADATLVTVELDDDRASAAGRLFSEVANVRVLHGDWHELLPREAPFDLLFFDGGGWKRPWEGDDTPGESDRALELVARGGVVVIDDLTPQSLMPEKWAKADLVRDYWLDDKRFIATEILTTQETAAIISVRR
jgi:predicted O-methyltransferase YrrM